MSTIGLIYARTTEGLIGYKGMMPWRIPEDLARFKELTLHSTIIMGRTTWDSLPIRPLPDRTNIVMTHRHDIEHPEVECMAGSLSRCIQYQTALAPEVPIWCIGGAGLLQEALELKDTNTIVETVIDGYDHRGIHAESATYFHPLLYKSRQWRKVKESTIVVWDRSKGPVPRTPPCKENGYYRMTEYHYERR